MTKGDLVTQVALEKLRCRVVGAEVYAPLVPASRLSP